MKKTSSKKITAQEIFNKVCIHLVKQGAPSFVKINSMSNITRCVYKNKENGRMCAIGCLIPDNIYDEKFEDDWDVKALAQGVLGLEFYQGNEDLLYDLQRVHDVLNFPETEGKFHVRIKNDLREVAKKNKLNEPEIIKENQFD